MQKLNRISKYLSFILRHKPEAVNLKLDEKGWADIDEIILKTKKFSLNRKLIEKVVLEDNKQRYIIDGDKIRANQGHSINVDLELKPQIPPKILYHGTATRFIDSIMKTGLKTQNRQYVHLSKDLKTAKNVGSRHGKVVILNIDTVSMLEDGVEFYISENGVWLTNHVPVKYITE